MTSALLRRTLLRRALRLALLAACVVGAVVGGTRLAATVDHVRQGILVPPPADDKAFRDTLIGALGVAALTLDFDGEIAKALAVEDVQAAQILAAAAARAGRPLAPETAAALAEATAPAATWGRRLRDAAWGGLTGEADSVAGLAGAVGVDLGVPLYGDARDVVWQSWRGLSGAGRDDVVLGLAAAGLVLPLAQPVSDTLKAALRFKRIAPGLKRTLRAAPAARLRQAAGDLGAIATTGGTGTLALALKRADGLEDLSLFRRTSAVMGDTADEAILVLGPNLRHAFRAVKLTWPRVLDLLAWGGTLLAALGGLVLSLLGWPVKRFLRRL